MPPEDIPEEREGSFPCECGGEITKFGNVWECDTCDFSFVPSIRIPYLPTSPVSRQSLYQP